MIGVGLVSLAALFVLAILGLAMLAGVITAIRHGRWGVLIGLGVVTTLPMLLILFAFVSYPRVQQDFGGPPHIELLSSPSPVEEARQAERLRVEAVTEAELLSLAAPEPSIQLEAEASAEDATAAEGEASQVETNADLPDWIEAQAKLNDKVFAAGPFSRQRECAEDTRQQILAWLCKKAGVAVPDEMPAGCEKLIDDLMRRTHLARRSTPDGIVYLQYTRAHSDDKTLERIREAVNSASQDIKEVSVNETPLAKGIDRPGWVDGDITTNQKVFTSGPFTTVDPCREDARKQLAKWVWEVARGENSNVPKQWGVASSEVEDRFDTDRYLEKRDTSVGEVYLLHTLGEINVADQQWLASRVSFWEKKAHRESGIQTVAIGGGLLLGAVGLLHGVLRSGVRQPETP